MTMFIVADRWAIDLSGCTFVLNREKAKEILEESNKDSRSDCHGSIIEVHFPTNNPQRTGLVKRCEVT